MNGWISFADVAGIPADPPLQTPLWLTNGHTVALVVRIADERHAVRSQYQVVLGFEWPDNPTHFAYAAPPLPTS